MRRSKSRGSVAFDQAVGSTAEKAAKVGVSLAAAQSWIRGDRQPPEPMAQQVEAAIGVPWLWWRELLAPEVPPAPPSPAALVAGSATPGAIADEADALLADVRAARELVAGGIADPAERIRILEKAASMVKSLAAIRGTLQSERQVIDNPHMRRIRARVLRALEPFPEAVAAVCDAFNPEVTE